MKKIHIKLEAIFEKITSIVTAILGSSITFIIALFLVIFWLSNRDFATQDINDSIRDIIHGVAFLSLFVIQKEFTRFSGSLYVKVNELVASNDTASNAVINVENKTESEIHALQKEYVELAGLVKEVEEVEEKIQEKAVTLKKK